MKKKEKEAKKEEVTIKKEEENKIGIGTKIRIILQGKIPMLHALLLGMFF